MVARRDAPEMFEAFRMAEAARQRRSQEDTDKKPEATEGETGKKDIPVLHARAGGEQASSRPAAAARLERPWAQEPAFYLPLGHRCQVVLSMSYQVALWAGVTLILLIAAAFVFGLLVGGCERVEEQVPGGESSEGVGVTPPPVTPPPVTPPPVTPPPVQPSQLYRVQVVTVDNTSRGQAELAEMKKALEERGYPDVEIKQIQRRSKLVILVGRFSQDQRTQADVLVARLKRESFKSRLPFREAYVVRSTTTPR